MEVKMDKWFDMVSNCCHCRPCASGDWHAMGEWAELCPKGLYFKMESFYAPGAMEFVHAYLRGDIDPADKDRYLEVFYTCTSCGACTVQCEKYSGPGQKLKKVDGKGRHLYDIWEDMKAEMVRLGWAPIEEHKKLIQSINENDNPYAQSAAERVKWCGKRKIKDASKENVDVLYFVGCTASYGYRSRYPNEVADATAQILDALGVNWGTLGNDEMCCGSPSKRIGQYDQFERLAKANIEKFNSLGVKTIVTSCAGCYSALKELYPDVGEIKPKVMHITEFLERQLKKKALKMDKEVKMKVTYHDPCHLGRHAHVYDAPRKVLEAIPGVELVEFPQCRENSWCCGAGAGVKAAYNDLALWTSKRRIDQAEKLDVEAVTSACPFCYRNLAEGAADSGSKLKVFDITELVAKAIAKK